MKMLLSAYSLLILAIIFGVSGQLLLKKGMSQRPDFNVSDALTLVTDFSIVAGFVSYAVSVLIYLKALANLELSLAYPTVSLGYVIVVVFSKILFKERVSPVRWAAVAIICTGIALVGLGSR
jgi:multidrug transporter EmrE-like cation transporter